MAYSHPHRKWRVQPAISLTATVRFSLRETSAASASTTGARPSRPPTSTALSFKIEPAKERNSSA